MTQPAAKSAMERMVALRDRLLLLDSGSGEAADLALLLAVAEAAQDYLHCMGKDDIYFEDLSEALTALNSKEHVG